MTDSKGTRIDVGDPVDALWFWVTETGIQPGQWRRGEITRVQRDSVASVRFFDAEIEALCQANPADRLFESHQLRYADA